MTTPANELRFTRVFDAPREVVFECMIDPEHLAHFWGPAGTTAPLEYITVDARPGGVFTVSTWRNTNPRISGISVRPAKLSILNGSSPGSPNTLHVNPVR